ncbi:MAG: VWA domain-containing protein [Brumimicrobium sp.]
MRKKDKYTYRIKTILFSLIGWELIFWLILYQLMSIFGVFSEDSPGERVVFLAPNYAWFLIVLLGFIGLFLFHIFERNKMVKRLGEEKLVHTFLSPVSSLRVFLRFFLIRNAFVFTILALMQPAFGDKTVEAETNGVELVFAIDISSSMDARDMSNENSRLEAAKRSMIQFVNQAPAGKIGLLVFAGNVYPQLPLTADKVVAKMYIDELSTDIMSNQGTNIGAALNEASVFFSNEKTKKVVVLITDGEDHEGGMESAYEALKDNNIELLILGLGSNKGALVPKSSDRNSGYLKDELGRSVISKINERMIRDIADDADGDFIISSDAFPNISKLLTQINSSDATNTVDLEFEVKENRYQWPLSLALISLLVLFVWESLNPHPKND